MPVSYAPSNPLIVGQEARSTYPFDRFTESAKKTLTLAQEEAERAHHSYIGTEHLLLGLMRNDGGVAARALRDLGLELKAIRNDIDRALGASERTMIQHIIPTSRLKRVIEMAFDDAQRAGSSVVGTDHLLIALVSEGQGVAAHVLLDRGLTVDQVREVTARLRGEGVHDEVRETRSPRPPDQGSGHLEMTDGKGRPVIVLVSFPADYSDEERQAMVSRIRAAVRDQPA